MDLTGLAAFGSSIIPGYQKAERQRITDLSAQEEFRQILDQRVRDQQAFQLLQAMQTSPVPYAQPMTMPQPQGTQPPQMGPGGAAGVQGMPGTPSGPTMTPGGVPLPTQVPGLAARQPAQSYMPPPPQMQMGGQWTVPQMARFLKAKNPNIDDATLFHAIASAQTLLNPEGKMELAQTKLNLQVQALEARARQGEESLQIRRETMDLRRDLENMRQQGANDRALANIDARLNALDKTLTERGRESDQTNATRQRGQDLRFDAASAKTDLQRELGTGKLSLDEKKLAQTKWYQDQLVALKQAGLSERGAEAEMRERIAKMRDTTTQRGQDITSADRRYSADHRASGTPSQEAQREYNTLATQLRGANSQIADMIRESGGYVPGVGTPGRAKYDALVARKNAIFDRMIATRKKAEQSGTKLPSPSEAVNGPVQGREGGGAPAAGPSTQASPARPTTQQEFDALPSGAVYIDPDDGKPYRKP